MPKIDFYLIPDAGEKQRMLFACRFIEKAYKQQHQVYIHTDNPLFAQQLDELLWTYRDDSFLPHDIYNNIDKNKESIRTAPIQIGFTITPDVYTNQRDILINFSINIPEFYSQFARIIELVSDDKNIQAAARERYKLYRMHGHAINTHKTSIEI